MNLTVRKYDPNDATRVLFDEARSMYSSTTYEISVYAEDFRLDRESDCLLKLLRRRHEGDTELTEYARCQLIADPYRRNRRFGTLLVNDTEHSELFDEIAPTDMRNVDDQFVLSVKLGTGDSHVVYAQVPVVIAPKVVQGD